MRITDLILESSIRICSLAQNRQQVIDEMVNLHFDAGNISSIEDFRDAVMKREEVSSTALGDGIAVPHAKCDAVLRPAVCVLTSKTGVDFDSPDGKPSKLFFMIAVNDQNDLHLEILSELVTLLMDEELNRRLIEAENPGEFIAAIEEFYESDDASISQSSECADNFGNEHKSFARILAVTACPTGIAHTYLAAEALKKSADEVDVSIKIETRGATGTRNVLTAEDIENCEVIIVAADKDVELYRFNGKKVLITDVASGVNKSSELIEKALCMDVPVYRCRKLKQVNYKIHKGKTPAAYRHLMNGVSYMLPFVIGGGIMIALAFLFDTLAGAPKDSDFGTHTSLSAFFMAIGDDAFGFMLPVLAGFIAKSIADRPGLAIGVVGGYLASLGCTFTELEGNPAAVSGFFGALAAGFAGGYIALVIKKLFSFLMDSVSVMVPTLFQPLLGIITIGAFMCAVNPYIGMLNMHITEGLAEMGETSRIILGFLLAAMMAIDMGGPFNKAAYVFGTAALANGAYNIMAAVMIGGMVPPLAIAVCCTVFRNLWTKTERKSAMVNYILGLCFITEGAIPYAAADPFRMISAFVMGSGVSGALSMMFNCRLRAPHGGIFVFPVIANVTGYIIALAAGTAVSALLIAFLRRKRFSAESEEEFSEGMI